MFNIRHRIDYGRIEDMRRKALRYVVDAQALGDYDAKRRLYAKAHALLDAAEKAAIARHQWQQYFAAKSPTVKAVLDVCDMEGQPTSYVCDIDTDIMIICGAFKDFPHGLTKFVYIVRVCGTHIVTDVNYLDAVLRNFSDVRGIYVIENGRAERCSIEFARQTARWL